MNRKRLVILLLVLGGCHLLLAQKTAKELGFGFRMGTHFYQPRVRLSQNTPKPGIDLRGSFTTGDPAGKEWIFEIGYLMSRTPDVRSFYSHRNGIWVQDAQCTNMNHYLTGGVVRRIPLFRTDWLKASIGLDLYYLFRNNAFCRYTIDSARLFEWQGPYSLVSRDRFYPVLNTGLEANLLESADWRICAYSNLQHQLPAFSLSGGADKNPAISSRYPAPIISLNGGLRFIYRRR